MRDLVRRIRDQLLATPDTVCLERARLVTEAWAEHEHEPAPLRRAYAFRHILRHMTLDLQSNLVFAGNTSSRPRGWMLLPEYGIGTDAQVMLENAGLQGILEGAIPQEITAFWEGRSFGGLSGIGHLAVDMEAVVHRGLLSLLEEVARFRDEGDEEGRAYREAMRISLEAVVEWAGRYAEAARAQAVRKPERVRWRGKPWSRSMTMAALRKVSHGVSPESGGAHDYALRSCRGPCHLSFLMQARKSSCFSHSASLCAVAIKALNAIQ